MNRRSFLKSSIGVIAGLSGLPEVKAKTGLTIADIERCKKELDRIDRNQGEYILLDPTSEWAVMMAEDMNRMVDETIINILR